MGKPCAASAALCYDKAMFRTPKKILAIKLRPLGDTVLLTAPLRELRKAYPEADIDVVVLSKWAPLFQGDPGIRRVWSYERHAEPTSRAKAVARLALQLRPERYDWVLNFHASPSSATLSFATGAPIRSIHFHSKSDKNRHSTVTVPGKGIPKPIMERDLDTLRAVGVHVPPGLLPSLAVPPSEKTVARERLDQLGLTGPLLTLGLGSSRPTKSWPLDRFAGVALDWVRKTGGAVLAVTGPEETSIEAEFLRSIDTLLGADFPETGEAKARIRSRVAAQSSLSLKQLCATLALSRVFVGNDAGPRHLAVAVDTPTVTLFGPEDPFEWHAYPLERHPYLYRENLPCRKDAPPGMAPWCALETCVEEQHRCLKTIGTAEVLEQALRVMSFSEGR